MSVWILDKKIGENYKLISYAGDMSSASPMLPKHLQLPELRNNV